MSSELLESAPGLAPDATAPHRGHSTTSGC
jgi:hypothetical protein